MKYFFLFFSLSILIGLNSCKKEEPTPTEDPVEEPGDPAVVVENYAVIDSTSQYLVSTQVQIDNGEFVFDIIGAGDIAEVGDIIVGIQNGGFLRKVTSVTQNGGQVTYQTEFASMDELFHDGTVSLDIDMNNSYQYKTNLSYAFTDEEIYNNSGVLITATGNMELDIPNFNSDITFKALGLGIESCSMEMTGATFNGNLTLNLSASGGLPLIDETIEIAGFKRPFVGSLGVIPVAGVITTDFVVKCNANIDAAANASIEFANNSPINFGCYYNSGSWSSNLSFTPNTSVNLGQVSGSASFNYHAELVPVISIEFYNVGGPYGSVALNNDVQAAVQSPSMDWHISSDINMVSTIGVQAEIFSFSLGNYNTSWTSSSLTYKTPHNISKISGDNQQGAVGTNLTNPIVVRIMDSNNSPQSNVPVYFNVTSGGGTVTAGSVLSDASGYAETYWAPGSGGTQQLSVSAKDGNGSNLSSSPVTFNATTYTFDFSWNTLPDTLSVPGGEGEISISTIGGMPPFQYKLDAGAYQGNSVFQGLIGGTYQVFVKDANNAEVNHPVTVDGL